MDAPHPSGGVQPEVVRAECGEAWFALDPDWRAQGMVVGRFGVNAERLGDSERRRFGCDVSLEVGSGQGVATG